MFWCLLKMNKSTDKEVQTNELTYEPQKHEFKYIKSMQDNCSNQLKPIRLKYHKLQKKKKKQLL